MQLLNFFLSYENGGSCLKRTSLRHSIPDFCQNNSPHCSYSGLAVFYGLLLSEAAASKLNSPFLLLSRHPSAFMSVNSLPPSLSRSLSLCDPVSSLWLSFIENQEHRGVCFSLAVGCILPEDSSVFSDAGHMIGVGMEVLPGALCLQHHSPMFTQGEVMVATNPQHFHLEVPSAVI